MEKKTYKVLGLMSGTSLDGLDIALCKFTFLDHRWQYSILEAETVSYSPEEKEILSSLMTTTAVELIHQDRRFGSYMGREVNKFLKKHNTTVDFVSSHGHTVFHQPEKGMTLQIGHGAALHGETSIPTVCDFRSLDVALSGQGAPLVPIGDELLFPDHTYCLNLGGISNISTKKTGKRTAYDICPVNLVLNLLANKKGLSYDAGGELARVGKYNQELFDELNGLDFYQTKGPKSLGREWIDTVVFPLIESYAHSTEDKLHTFCHHIGYQISRSIADADSNHDLFITGGGAFNTFLIEAIQNYVQVKILIPESKIVMFKEALIFAFLGVLRVRGEVNCLSAVTGSKHDNVGGAIWGFI
ncbi:MAG TPA: anhydro-N-acetylmuramic acid kinase [Cytophagaceae bacterium]|jgi:anhydro-N-acetylmuramic acid kinase